MQVEITRHTGFYAMGSPLKVTISGQDDVYLANDSSKTLQLPDGQSYHLQVSFQWLTSPVYTYEANGQAVTLEVVMNPALIRIYLFLFVLLLAVPLLTHSLWLTLPLILVYFLVLKRLLKQAYLIRQISLAD